MLGCFSLQQEAVESQDRDSLPGGLCYGPWVAKSHPGYLQEQTTPPQGSHSPAVICLVCACVCMAFSFFPSLPPTSCKHNLQRLICLLCAIHYKRLRGSIDSVYNLQILISNEACSFSGKNYLLYNKPESPEAFI